VLPGTYDEGSPKKTKAHKADEKALRERSVLGYRREKQTSTVGPLQYEQQRKKDVSNKVKLKGWSGREGDIKVGGVCHGGVQKNSVNCGIRQIEGAT